MDFNLDFGGIEHLNGWERFDMVMICLMTIGQIIFVTLWLVLPWWREWVGRALMVKAATFCFLLILTLTNTMLSFRGIDYPGINLVQAVGYSLVVFGVWSQTFALAYEIRKGNVNQVITAYFNGKEGQMQKYRPLMWSGIIIALTGITFVVTTDWDVLSLVATGVGIGLFLFQFLITRPVEIEEHVNKIDSARDEDVVE